MANLSTDSTSPTVVATGDASYDGSGQTNAVRYSQRAKTFFDSMSPAGASVYDTGWQTVTPASGFTATVGLQVRRIGMQGFWRGRVNRTAGNFVVGTSYTIVATGGVPSGFYPTTSFAHTASAVTDALGNTAYVAINTDGSMTLVAGGVASNNYFLKNLSGYPVN